MENIWFEVGNQISSIIQIQVEPRGSSNYQISIKFAGR